MFLVILFSDICLVELVENIAYERNKSLSRNSRAESLLLFAWCMKGQREWNKSGRGILDLHWRIHIAKSRSTITFYNSFTGFKWEGESLRTCEMLGKRWQTGHWPYFTICYPVRGIDKRNIPEETGGDTVQCGADLHEYGGNESLWAS